MAQITISTATMVFDGKVMTRSVLVDGRGFAELVLPDADPQQRRDLERAERYAYELYLDGKLLYSSPVLTLRDTRRDETGALVVTGSP
ncbi:hypothetical protein ACFRSX_29700 [Streptomyces goshikiensis]|uniref:hypothetical protein n=1 Tax=Streptomyces TaxID=1883 RepID=UPI000C26E7F7|nr:hypothetical protein [Streptomyces sp. CB02120-2]PJN17341.1 hypothetical protein CG724_16960 [Streptomyces sp. CB02120-2]